MTQEKLQLVCRHIGREGGREREIHRCKPILNSSILLVKLQSILALQHDMQPKQNCPKYFKLLKQRL